MCCAANSICEPSDDPSTCIRCQEGDFECDLPLPNISNNGLECVACRKGGDTCQRSTVRIDACTKCVKNGQRCIKPGSDAWPGIARCIRAGMPVVFDQVRPGSVLVKQLVNLMDESAFGTDRQALKKQECQFCAGKKVKCETPAIDASKCVQRL
jgi:hypothetical protein